MQILYEWQPEIRIVRVNDRPVTGLLRLEKTDSFGHPLEGAGFELAAYRKAEGEREAGAEPVFRMRLRAPSETADLLVGEVLENGSIHPYWYELRETEAPEGYALNPEVLRWQFEADTGVSSYPWNGQAWYQVTVTDRKEPETPGPGNTGTGSTGAGNARARNTGTGNAGTGDTGGETGNTGRTGA